MPPNPSLSAPLTSVILAGSTRTRAADEHIADAGTQSPANSAGTWAAAGCAAPAKPRTNSPAYANRRVDEFGIESMGNRHMGEPPAGILSVLSPWPTLDLGPSTSWVWARCDRPQSGT